MIITNYEQDLRHEVINMIKHTIRSVNSQDYSYVQICAWSDVNFIDWEILDRDFQNIVAKDDDDNIIGFASMNDKGYLDQIFVHKNFQREGIASKLLKKLEASTDSDVFSTYASITAKPFFVAHGYEVTKKNFVNMRGEQFLNYYMEKK